MQVGTAAEEAPEVITPEMAANEREWQVDAAGAHNARSEMVAPAHVSRPETYGVISNQALAHAGFAVPITGDDQSSLNDAIAAVRANPFDVGPLAMAVA